MDDASRGDPPPFLRMGDEGASPLVLSVPHAGRHYPARIETDRAVPRAVLEQIEDRHADRLIGPLVAGGALAIVATHARAWIDLNRGEADRSSARARGGLGIVPSRVSGQSLWRRAIAADDLTERLATLHQPYHAAIGQALAAARRRHGHALLIDCHSMPPLAAGASGSAPARIVIGDRHGTSAGRGVAAAAMRAAERHGVTVARNAPYAGAYTLERHGRPAADIHAIQLEIDRSLYLQAGLREPAAGLAAVAAIVTDIALSTLAMFASEAIAAE